MTGIFLDCGFTFSVVNLGCKVNRVESDIIHAGLLERGGTLVDPEFADLIVVNTCTVTAEADKKTRKTIRQCLAKNTSAQVIATGCSAQIHAQELSTIDGRVHVVFKANVLDYLGIREEAPDLLRIGDDFRTRVNMKIQDGCNHACTYCIVHHARGPARSVPSKTVLGEAWRYLEAGVGELVLTGIDVGSYDDGTYNLALLTRTLVDMASASGDHAASRIRLSSIEPQSLDDALIDVMESSGGTLCRHLHLPLQSGSTKVLSEMDRPYTAEWYVQMVESLRRRIPSLSLTTDIIVGFPGETEEDFAQTLDVARACKFSKIHVFPYSMRQGTPAAERDDQIDAETKRERARALRTLSDELRSADFESRVGTEELVLVEPDEVLTESYHVISRPAGFQVGRLLNMHIDATMNHS